MTILLKSAEIQRFFRFSDLILMHFSSLPLSLIKREGLDLALCRRDFNRALFYLHLKRE